MKEHIREILKAMGEDPDREGLKKNAAARCRGLHFFDSRL
jgi:GTP cyclohydrolase I